jgi:translation initiation factor IF-3
MFNAIIQDLGEKIKVERPPRSEGRRLIMILAPTKKA